MRGSKLDVLHCFRKADIQKSRLINFIFSELFTTKVPKITFCLTKDFSTTFIGIVGN